MIIADSKIQIKGSRQAIWHKLVDWQTMHTWDIFMDSVRFDGPLQPGSKGKLKMKGGPEVELVVTSFDEAQSYTDEFTLLGSRFIFFHELIEHSENEVVLHITVETDGLLASLLAPLMRSDMERKMPILMNNFKTQFEMNKTNA